MSLKRSPIAIRAAILLAALLAGSSLLAQSTAFNYQGRLMDAGAPANGIYDFRFSLQDADVSGNIAGGPLLVEDVAVSNGLFNVLLDFGAAGWTGANRWLEIALRPGASAGDFTNLAPRQFVSSTPFAIRAAQYGGAVSAAQITGTLSPANLAAGAITPDKLSAEVSNTLSAAAANALATVSNNFIGMFETVSQPVPVWGPDTNSIWVSAAGAVGFTQPQQFWRAADNLFTNAYTVIAGRRVTNNGAYWLIERGALTGLYTNATLTGAYGVGNGIAPAPVVSWATNIVGTNFVPRLRENVGAEAYAALAFKGGQSGWPPYGADERGFMLFSVDGRNWIGGTGRPVLDEPMRNGGFIRVGGAFAFGYSPHTSTQMVTHVALRVTTNFADWDFRTNLSAALPGETLPPNTRTWVATQPLVIVGTNLWFFFSVSTNGGPTGADDPGSFHQRALACPLSTFPRGWSAAYAFTFPRTNVIDFNPFYDAASGKLFGLYKDESRTMNELAVFSSLDLPNAEIQIANENPFGPFPVGEAAIIVGVPGGYRAYRTLFLYDYGSFGRGHAIIYQDTTNLVNGWPDFAGWKVINAAADFQAFGVLRLTNHVDIQNAMAAAVGSGAMSGVINIRGALGEQYTGRLDRGFAFTNSPNQPNDHAGINIGTESWTAGGWGVQRANNQYRMDWWLADDSVASGSYPYVSSYARMIASAQTNRFDFFVPVFGDGAGLTNLPASAIRSTAATLGGTNEFSGVNRFASGLSVGAHPVASLSSNALGPLVLGSNHLWLDAAGNVRKASGTTLHLGGAAAVPALTDAGGTALLSGNLAVSGSAAANGGVLLPGATTAPSGLTTLGSHLWSDGTNVLVILQNAAGLRITNKVVLAPWP